MARPARRRGSVALVPRDVAGELASGQHVDVPVTVEIRCNRRGSSVEGRVDGSFRPTPVVGRSIVLVPRDGIRIHGGSEHVEISVPVDVRRGHRLNAVERSVDRAERPVDHVERPVVLVPHHVARVLRRANQIEIPVAVQVRRADRDCSVAAGEDSFGPRRRIGAVVLVDDELVRVVGGHHHVLIAVAIDVGRAHRRRAILGAVDRAQRPSAVQGRAVVLEPDDVSGHARGAEDIEVAVAIHVGGAHRVRAGDAVRENSRGPRRAIARHVLVPRHLVQAVVGRDHIEVAVTVHVAGRTGRDRVQRRGDAVPGRKRCAAMDRDVAIPDDRAGARTRRHEVHVPIAIEILGDNR